MAPPAGGVRSAVLEGSAGAPGDAHGVRPLALKSSLSWAGKVCDRIDEHLSPQESELSDETRRMTSPGDHLFDRSTDLARAPFSGKVSLDHGVASLGTGLLGGALFPLFALPQASPRPRRCGPFSTAPAWPPGW